MTDAERLADLKRQVAELEKRIAEKAPEVVWIHAWSQPGFLTLFDPYSDRQKATACLPDYGGRVVPYVCAEDAGWGTVHDGWLKVCEDEEKARELAATYGSELLRIIAVPWEVLND